MSTKCFLSGPRWRIRLLVYGFACFLRGGFATGAGSGVVTSVHVPTAGAYGTMSPAMATVVRLFRWTDIIGHRFQGRFVQRLLRQRGGFAKHAEENAVAFQQGLQGLAGHAFGGALGLALEPPLNGTGGPIGALQVTDHGMLRILQRIGFRLFGFVDFDVHMSGSCDESSPRQATASRERASDG